MLSFLFFERQVKLTINLKRAVLENRSWFTILGFLFASTYQKGVKGRYQLARKEKLGKTRLKEANAKPQIPEVLSERPKSTNPTEDG
jgi:hypothetical protein